MLVEIDTPANQSFMITETFFPTARIFIFDDLDGDDEADKIESDCQSLSPLDDSDLVQNDALDLHPIEFKRFSDYSAD